MDKPKVFISHVAEEAKLAEILKTHVQRDFLGMIDVFVSSDSSSISVGNKWLNEVDQALKSAEVELILCSEESVSRPWINFEAGAGWVKGIPVVPVCHTGLRPVDLPIPLSMLQAIEATDAAGLQRVYSLLAKNLSSEIPNLDATQIIKEVRDFEQEYGVVRKVREAVKSIIKTVPELEGVFRADPVSRQAQGEVPDFVLDKMRPHLQLLQEMGMLQFGTGQFRIVIGETGGGNMLQLNIVVNDQYYMLAQRVMD
jgi:hypothetical protein